MRTFEEQIIFDFTGIKVEMFTNYQNLTVDKTQLTKMIRTAYNKAIEDLITDDLLLDKRINRAKYMKSISGVD